MGCIQQVNGLFEPAFLNVTAETHAGVLMKCARKMIGRASKLAREPDDGKFGPGQFGKNLLPALANQGWLFRARFRRGIETLDR